MGEDWWLLAPGFLPLAVQPTKKGGAILSPGRKKHAAKSSIGAVGRHLKGCGLKRRCGLPIQNVARTRKNPAQGGEAPREGSDPRLPRWALHGGKAVYARKGGKPQVQGGM